MSTLKNLICRDTGKGYIFSLSSISRTQKFRRKIFVIRIKNVNSSCYALYISPYGILIYRQFDEMFVAIQERERGRHYGHPRSSVTVTLLRSGGNVRTFSLRKHVNERRIESILRYRERSPRYFSQYSDDKGCAVYSPWKKKR